MVTQERPEDGQTAPKGAKRSGAPLSWANLPREEWPKARGNSSMTTVAVSTAGRSDPSTEATRTGKIPKTCGYVLVAFMDDEVNGCDTEPTADTDERWCFVPFPLRLWSNGCSGPSFTAHLHAIGGIWMGAGRGIGCGFSRACPEIAPRAAQLEYCNAWTQRTSRCLPVSGWYLPPTQASRRGHHFCASRLQAAERAGVCEGRAERGSPRPSRHGSQVNATYGQASP